MFLLKEQLGIGTRSLFCTQLKGRERDMEVHLNMNKHTTPFIIIRMQAMALDPNKQHLNFTRESILSLATQGFHIRQYGEPYITNTMDNIIQESGSKEGLGIKTTNPQASNNTPFQIQTYQEQTKYSIGIPLHTYISKH